MKRPCQYKDILGEPRKGIHEIRLFDFAIVDIILTFILAYGLTLLTGYDYWIMLLFSFLLAIILHWLFCVDTRLNVMLFGYQNKQ